MATTLGYIGMTTEDVHAMAMTSLLEHPLMEESGVGEIRKCH